MTWDDLIENCKHGWQLRTWQQGVCFQGPVLTRIRGENGSVILQRAWTVCSDPKQGHKWKACPNQNVTVHIGNTLQNTGLGKIGFDMDDGSHATLFPPDFKHTIELVTETPPHSIE